MTTPARRCLLALGLCAATMAAAALPAGAPADAPVRIIRTGPGGDAPAAPTRPIDAAARAAVVEALAGQLAANYVFPEVAESVIRSLRARVAAGGYDDATDTVAFAQRLTADLRATGKDGHFRVAYDPAFRKPDGAPRIDGPGPATGSPVIVRRVGGPAGPAPAGDGDDAPDPARLAFGIDRVERLPGNIGYVELRGFLPGPAVRQAMSNTMHLLSGTDAMIVDLRRNGGGDPVQVAWWMSHFFPAGTKVHLNDIYNRPDDATESFFTDPAAPVHYAGPVYVLTSKRTFSGGEECAYDFQTQKRATLVGEATGGGANPGERFPLAHGFVAFVPTGRAINPVTKTNWEHTGVQPDVRVPAVDALKTAHVALLREAIASTDDPTRRQRLGEVLADVTAGRAPAP